MERKLKGLREKQGEARRSLAGPASPQNSHSPSYRTAVLPTVLTFQLLEQEGFPAPPLRIQPHTDGRLHGRLAEDVSQCTAVQVIAKHVAVCFRRGQVS